MKKKKKAKKVAKVIAKKIGIGSLKAGKGVGKVSFKIGKGIYRAGRWGVKEHMRRQTPEYRKKLLLSYKTEIRIEKAKRKLLEEREKAQKGRQNTFDDIFGY